VVSPPLLSVEDHGCHLRNLDVGVYGSVT